MRNERGYKMRGKVGRLKGRGQSMRIPCEEQENLYPESAQPLPIGELHLFISKSYVYCCFCWHMVRTFFL